MKKLLSILAVCLLGIAIVGGCGGTAGEKPEAAQKDAQKFFLKIATGGTAGTYYPLGGAIVGILNQTIPGMSASAQSTGASVANINLLKDGKVDLAFVQNDIAYYAANGIEMFKGKKVDNLKGLVTLYPETVQIIALESSGIRTIADIKGKKVAVGAAGSGTEANARQILEAYGITYQDIKVQYLSFAEAATGLKDVSVDVAFVTAGFPTAAIEDIAKQREIVLLAVDKAKIAGLTKKYPFYTEMAIPGGTYYRQEADIPAIAVSAILAVNDKVSDGLGYKITQAIYGNLERLKAAHAVGNTIVKENAKIGMPIAFNAGAEKYLNEK